MMARRVGQTPHGTPTARRSGPKAAMTNERQGIARSSLWAGAVGLLTWCPTPPAQEGSSRDVREGRQHHGRILGSPNGGSSRGSRSEGCFDMHSTWRKLRRRLEHRSRERYAVVEGMRAPLVDRAGELGHPSPATLAECRAQGRRGRREITTKVDEAIRRSRPMPRSSPWDRSFALNGSRLDRAHKKKP